MSNIIYVSPHHMRIFAPFTHVDQCEKPVDQLLLLTTLQMDDQCLKAIFKDFFSQLRLLRPVASLHLAGCGLTRTCALSKPDICHHTIVVRDPIYC